ncbi:MAG: hypothetical protein V3T44_04520, partial [bacterium]
SSPDSVAAVLGGEGLPEASAATAAELARCVRTLAGADTGLSVLGPILGGVEEEVSSPNPTHIVVVSGGDTTPSVEYCREFGGSGRFLQDRVAITALDVLRRHLLGAEQLQL